MIIPIPSNKERLTITLNIEAYHPFQLGMRVYDPDHPNTYYFRRKSTFIEGKLKRELKIPLPVSPQLLELELYNKDTGDDYDFKIQNFEIEKMPSGKVWATDEQHRFLEFAIQFAQKAGYVPTGFYDSPNHEFLFQYLPSITDAFGKELITPARTHRKMPRVQISQRMFKSYSIPIRVAILAHEGCHWFLNTRSQKTADLCGIKQYLDYGFPTIEAVYAVTKVFGQHPEVVGESQIQRTKDVIAFIDKYKADA
ncbi:hypothetical protein [Flavivirga rizhaonensis]|uniref:Uncharacterized protein n=1 Tax=Flavivirga rizhaonensis TaxID=2559571 RepID=A0A4S1E164_9FLAO|nr:hypothetical protein [Flavivirga rizhaonensis]TGV03632.1 hypothetical protein EM932_06295 [Flavivirga rizhaonensis]